MSTCPNHELISAYIDNEVPSEFSAMIAAHLEVCPKCRAVYTAYHSIDTTMKHLGDAAPMPDFSSSFDRLMIRRAAVVNEKHESNIVSSWFYASVKVPVPLIAAAVLLFVLVPLFFFLKIESSLGAAQDPFKLVMPVSVEKTLRIPERECYVSPDLSSESLAVYQFPSKDFIKNTKLFPVREFTQFYLKNPTFADSQSGMQKKLPLSEFPLQLSQETTAEFQPKIMHR